MKEKLRRQLRDVLTDLADTARDGAKRLDRNISLDELSDLLDDVDAVCIQLHNGARPALAAQPAKPGPVLVGG